MPKFGSLPEGSHRPRGVGAGEALKDTRHPLRWTFAGITEQRS